MKKALLTGCIVVLSLFSVGCAKTIDLTDEENYLIAEYAAELLLKYDRNTHMKYYSDEPLSEEAETVTTEAPTTEEGTEESTEEVTTTEAVTTEEQGTNIPDTEEEVTGIVADSDASFDIAEYAGENNVSVKYAYYMLADRYPSYSQDGMFMEIEAPAGYKLLVLKFDVENKTNEAQSVDMYSKGLEYNIIINDKRSAKQMLTILIDDLYTYQMNLEGSMREEAVLLFQISEGMADSIEDLKLKVINGNDSKVIWLQ